MSSSSFGNSVVGCSAFCGVSCGVDFATSAAFIFSLSIANCLWNSSSRFFLFLFATKYQTIPPIKKIGQNGTKAKNKLPKTLKLFINAPSDLSPKVSSFFSSPLMIFKSSDGVEVVLEID